LEIEIGIEIGIEIDGRQADESTAKRADSPRRRGGRRELQEKKLYLLSVQGQRSSTFGKSRTSWVTRPVLLRRYKKSV
jgi:hypothetical protein